MQVSRRAKRMFSVDRFNLLKKIHTDYNRIYLRANFTLGWPKDQARLNTQTARKNTAAIVGAAFGDEGKGRIIDNIISAALKKKGVKKVYVIRFQGGNNAGHTVVKGKLKLALHVVPSGILYKKAVGIMDYGMVIHIEDLQSEVKYLEKAAGSLNNRLFLSDNAILCTDIERAEEYLNRIKEGRSKGGTGRGIGPSYAHHYDKTGLRISDLLVSDWETKLKNHYLRYQKEFAAFNLNLEMIDIPDFKQSLIKQKSLTRKVGDLNLFISRLKKSRTWLLKREMILNTYRLHLKIANDPAIAILFEGAQAAGLDAWLGARPDVTSSNTSVYGIREGTGFWRIQDIANKIGVIKIPYSSSVGSRKMPTHIDLPSNLQNQTNALTEDQQWGAYIRDEAHEYGATTGRPRDINFLDLALLEYNVRMSGIETLIVTHADIARKTDNIKVCTHYINKKGELVSYQPGLRYLEDAIPQYITLPGWDGKICKKAKSYKELPLNCQKFLAFTQARLGIPITAVTTGPNRKNFITLNGFLL